uniref:Uncharacterized protein n=1 Tax=Oryzias melastigma TaxID=30732 RepID=A0A3B3DX47_ORYME
MFRCRTAWFSKSVNEAHLKFWVQEGGTITGWRKADFIFSEDATSSDTLRIYESKDFLWDKVTVFHSLFLSTCEKRQSVRSVSIGHYVLPPVSVQHGKDYSRFIDLFMDSLQKYSGELSDYHSKHFPCLNCGVCVCLTTTKSNEM